MKTRYHNILPTLLAALLLAPAAAAAAPAAPPEPPALPATPPGWDSCKWYDPLHQTPKYVVGRIVAAFPHTPNGLALALPAIDAAYPGSKITRPSGDKVDIPCVGVIDMIVNSGDAEQPDSGDSWSWQVVTDKCGACEPNKCEAVSKSTKCKEAAAAPKKTPGGLTRGGVTTVGGGGGGTKPPAAGGGASAGGSHPDRSSVVAEAKQELEAAGKDLSGPCGAFAIVKLAVWKMRDEGAGLLDKPSGNNCEGYATDIIAYADGQIYDVLVAGGESNGPAWQSDGTVDPGRYRPAVDPGAP